MKTTAPKNGSNRIKKVADRWLSQKRSQLKMLARGADNPNYEPLRQEIEAAEEQNRRAEELDEMARAKGFVPNKYDGVCAATGRQVAAYEGYVKKSESGRWETYCLTAVLDY